MNSADLLKYLKNPALLNESTLDEVKNLVSDYPWFGMGWLLYARNLKNLDHVDYLPVQRNAALRISDRKLLKHYLEREIGSIKPDENISSTEPEGDYFSVSARITEDPAIPGKNGLIEDFLANGAVFQPLTPRDVNKNLPDLAEVAVRENDDILTETYANLLLTQGKSEKAIDAFKKLSLKYPEKSIYFAARIEEIKNRAD